MPVAVSDRAPDRAQRLTWHDAFRPICALFPSKLTRSRPPASRAPAYSNRAYPCPRGSRRFDHRQDAPPSSHAITSFRVWLTGQGHRAVIETGLVNPDPSGQGDAGFMLPYAEHTPWAVSCGIPDQLIPSVIENDRWAFTRHAGTPRFAAGAGSRFPRVHESSSRTLGITRRLFFALERLRRSSVQQ